MGIVVKSKESEDEREPIPPGIYVGGIIGVYDVGTQDGQFGKKHQVVVQTELHKKRGPAVDSKGRPFVVSQFYNLSFGTMNGKRSKLRADVEVIVNHTFTDEEAERGYDIQNLLGESYRLNLVESIKPDGKKFAKVTSVMPLEEDEARPEIQSDEVYFERDAETIKAGKLDGIPAWIAKFVQRSEEWVAVHGTPKNDGTNGSTPSLPPSGAIDRSNEVPH
jgi:hypothetical protein